MNSIVLALLILALLASAGWIGYLIAHGGNLNKSVKKWDETMAETKRLLERKDDDI